MMAGDLTRAQLISALHCCASNGMCKQCPLYQTPPKYPVDCFTRLMYYAAELLSLDSIASEDAPEIIPAERRPIESVENAKTAQAP